MAKSAINEIMYNYCKKNDFQGLQCLDHKEPFATAVTSCSCTLEELRDSKCINSDCFPIKMYLHSDGEYYRWEEIFNSEKDVI